MAWFSTQTDSDSGSVSQTCGVSSSRTTLVKTDLSSFIPHKILRSLEEGAGGPNFTQLLVLQLDQSSFFLSFHICR